MDEARAGREAIAKRYAGCTVIKVEDTHTSEKRTGHIATDTHGLPEPYENVPRNKVIVTVEAELAPEAIEAEAKYANGTPNAKDVQWDPFSAAGDASVLREDPKNPDKRTRALPIPDHSTSEKTGPATETFTITMYPRTDEKRRTTSAEISLGTHVETYDKTGNNGNGTTYRAAGRISCGMIYEDVDISDPTKLEPGPLTWQISQSGAEGIEAFTYTEETCVNVPTGPNSYDEQCNWPQSVNSRILEA